MIIATHGIVASQILTVPVATAATSVGDSSFTANWNAYSGANYYLLDVSLNSSFSSFVGAYQNYLVYSTSQVVSGLSSNTTYYYRVRAVTGIDSDVASFITRVYTAGGTLSYTEATATEQLVSDLKGYSIWTKMKAIYPMVGASSAACAQNLKSSSFTGTFFGGWTYASTGVTPNGTTGYMDTFFNPSVNGMSSSNGHISVYTRSNLTGTNICLIGVIGAIDEIAINFFSADVFAMFGNTPYPGFVQVDKRGFYSVSRDTSTTVKNYFNGAVKINGVTVNYGTNPNAKILLGVQGNSTGSRGNFSSNEQAFASIGDTLNSTESGNLYTAVQTFNTTLSRQV